MLVFIISTGLAVGAIYAMIGIAYNIMFSTSRVISFTAGQLGMIGGVFGSLFALQMGLGPVLALLLSIAACAVFGMVTELVAVRPVLRHLDKHLYVLSTLALALMVQNLTAITWGTEPKPFPKFFFDVSASGLLNEKFWMPCLALAVTIGGLELLYRRSLIGRAFLAIAEDNFAARALGLPERGLRVASFGLAGAIGGLAGFAGGQLMLAFFVNGSLFSFYGFIAVALGGLGNNWGAVVIGLLLGVVQQAANFAVGGVMASALVFALFIAAMLLAPQGVFNKSTTRRV
jgi:branched-chain amino acid transport system permease protein